MTIILMKLNIMMPILTVISMRTLKRIKLSIKTLYSETKHTDNLFTDTQHTEAHHTDL